MRHTVDINSEALTDHWHDVMFTDSTGQKPDLTVVAFVGEDGALVVQIDTEFPAPDATQPSGYDRLRLNVNDATVFDRAVERGDDYGDDDLL